MLLYRLLFVFGQHSVHVRGQSIRDDVQGRFVFGLEAGPQGLDSRFSFLAECPGARRALPGVLADGTQVLERERSTADRRELVFCHVFSHSNGREVERHVAMVIEYEPYAGSAAHARISGD